MSENAITTPDASGHRVIVAGGTGSVGEGIVRSWLDAGAHVIVPTRSQARLEEFRGVLGMTGATDRLTLLVADYTTAAGAKDFADTVEREVGPVTDAVASVGSWWAGSALSDTTQAAWDEYFIGYATTHLALAQAFVPRLTAEGAYHVIVGASAKFPVQGSGIVSMQQAALLMMGKVLQAESGAKRRVFTHLLGVVNNRNRPQQRAEWIGATDVGALTAIVSTTPEVASANYELLDMAAFRNVLDEITESKHS